MGIVEAFSTGEGGSVADREGGVTESVVSAASDAGSVGADLAVGTLGIVEADCLVMRVVRAA